MIDCPDKITVLHTVAVDVTLSKPILIVVERRTTCASGVERTFINVVLRIGTKSVFLPRRLVTSIGKALLHAAASADAAYTSLLEEQNKERDHG